MNDVHVYNVDLPLRVKGLVVPDDCGYTVYLNNRLSREQNMLTLKHEMEHIRRGDCYADEDADMIECR